VSARAEDSGFTPEERAAMAARAAELTAARKGRKGAAKIESDMAAAVDAIDALPPEERAIAARIHAIVLEIAPDDLLSRTWYGMPAYARDGTVVCFYQPAAKFGTRYGTLGFSDAAALDDGLMWPTAYAVTSTGDDVVAAIEALVRRATG